jgi:hypothetical protein
LRRKINNWREEKREELKLETEGADKATKHTLHFSDMLPFIVL